MIHAHRRDRLRRVVLESGLDGPLLVTDLANVRYLTGFSGSNAVLVISPDPAGDRIGTDGRYRDQVAEQCPDLPTVIDRQTLSAVARGCTDVIVESSLTIGEVRDLRELGIQTATLGPVIEGFRAVKDSVEIAALERACTITAAAFAALAGEIRVGDTERGLARRLEQLFGEGGAEDRAFPSIVASGPHSAIPHHEPGGRRLAAGDLLVIDAGARVDGYHADMTRTFLVAADAGAWQAEVHEAVRRAQAAAVSACRPGAQARAVDAEARTVLAAAGFEAVFTHGLGHGVGLVIHEAPMIGQHATGTIDANMAITAEPGAYLLGRGGVRIEDTLVVTDSGPRILTEAPRDLMVVG